MPQQVQDSRSSVSYDDHEIITGLSYEMFDLHENRFLATGTLHHVQDGIESLIDIASRGKALSSSTVTNITRLPSQFISLAVEAHLCIHRCGQGSHFEEYPLGTKGPR